FFLGAALEQVVLKPEKPPRHSCGSWKTCLPVTSGRSPYHRTLQSRSVALSRCPDAAWIVRTTCLHANGTEVDRQSLRDGRKEKASPNCIETTEQLLYGTHG